ncbi:permease [Nocardia arthritidis]|uniref:Permease n=1 Tax=Nocardia arthritidis TaxID=228602 RepID=A0A6G9YDH9_9NOCA|nr:permease [Nocardia arthritidis]QIS11063.1 permease [Nocardia arthritidis]
MTDSYAEPKSFWARWRARIVGGLAFVAVLFVAYFILAAFIPRWWAQRVGDLVGKSFGKGIAWGLAYGGLGTAITLFLLLFAVLIWRRRAGKVLAGAAGVIAILAAIPNLMTLTIVLGTGSASQAGKRIMDVEAPAFRGASLAGAIAAAVLFLLTAFLVIRRRWRKRRAGKRVAPPPAQVAAPAPVADSGDTEATRQAGM